jgi:hypothetical protein
VINPTDLLKPRTLYGTAGALVLLGLALRVAPVTVPDASGALRLPGAARPATPEPIGGDESSYAPVAAGNVFSQSRRPPKVRFVPEGREQPEMVTARPRSPAPALRLYGITAGAGGTIALIDADPKVPGAELYRLGDRIAGARISSITDSTVVISRPSGPLTLRLPSSLRSRR